MTVAGRDRRSTGRPIVDQAISAIDLTLWLQTALALRLSRLGAEVLHAPAIVGPLLAPRLLVVGKRGGGRPEIERSLEELGTRRLVQFLGYAKTDLLPTLYSAADLFVFPSLHEGFGLPLLEAMACGVPAVVSNRSALPEVAGTAAALVDPTDRKTLADIIRRLLAGPAARADLSERGRARASTFTWARAARATGAVYEEAARR